jgi:alkanesulfonate monooxygenase
MGGIRLHWFLPTHGDGRSVVDRPWVSPVGAAAVDREPDIDYLAQVALAAESLGFEGMLTPTGSWCQDAWLTTAALLGRTRRIKFLVAFRPGALTPTLAAQMAATYQRVSGGRLLLNIVTGGDPLEQARFGDRLSHDQRYDRTDEFMAILREVWSGSSDFTGTHYDVDDAQAFARPDPVPPLYFGGSSDAGMRVAARRADVHLTWGEPPDAVAAKLTTLRKYAAEEGRELRFGVRVHTISRDTSEEAWAVAQKMYDQFDPAEVAEAQASFAAGESEGQRRMAALHGGALGSDARSLEVYPGLWAGVGLVRGGAGTALVGSHTEVADLIETYHGLGCEDFVLSGYPHLEEAFWFGEGVRPELARRGLLAA